MAIATSIQGEIKILGGERCRTANVVSLADVAKRFQDFNILEDAALSDFGAPGAR
jgi:hypothetical protein